MIADVVLFGLDLCLVLKGLCLCLSVCASFIYWNALFFC